MTSQNRQTTRVFILVFAILAIFAVISLFQSGVFAKDPVVEAVPDNCYTQTLHVITDEDYSPYSFYDENGKFSGYDVELITLIANYLHMNLDLRFMGWNEGIEAVSRGAAEVLMTCDYSDSFQGVDHMLKSESTSYDDFIVYANRRVTSISSLYGKRIAVMENGNVTPQMEMLGLSDFCVNYPDNREALQALIDGKVDYAVMRQSVGTTLLKELGVKNKKTKACFSAGISYMCFCVNVAEPELRDKLNEAIEEMKFSGECERLRQKWLTTFVHPYTLIEILSMNLWLAALMVLFVVLAVAYYIRTKQREIAERDEAYKKEMEYQEKLEAANKSKTDFLFNMSHDIRTPMNAIIGFTDMAKRHIDDKDRVIDSLSKIESSGSHLLELINEVLDMSRVEAGKLRSDMKVVKISDAAHRLISICHESAAQRNIALSLQERNIFHYTVLADELHINQVLMNILGNAIKYTNPGGSVDFIVAEEPSEVDGYGKFIFTVEDTGIGMSKEFLSKVFDSFSREDNAFTSEIQGTGLGMSIVKHLVDYMDGTINVESEQGKGTKVTVTLHLKPVDAVQEQKKPETQIDVDLSGKKVLLVEDNELNREIAEMLLSERGMEVEGAVNGIDAVDHVKEKGVSYYDFVLMDVQMPQMDGYEATKEIRRLPGSEKLPIIALSANAFEEDRKRSIEAGMNEHVAKPIDMSELMRALAKFVKPAP